MTDRTELALLRQDVEEMKKEMEKLNGRVKDLLEAWQTATGLLRVIKWLAGIATAGAVIVSTYKGFK